MALLVLIALLAIPLILPGFLVKKDKKRDSGKAFVIFGILIIIIMYLFSSGGSSAPILNRDISLYSFGTTSNYHSAKVDYKVPFGFGVCYVAVGALILLLVKK